MRRWLAKLRGLLGLGLACGVSGAMLGAIWWVGASVVGVGEIAFGSLPWTVGLWSAFGAFAAAGAVADPHEQGDAGGGHPAAGSFSMVVGHRPSQSPLEAGELLAVDQRGAGSAVEDPA